MSVVDPRQRSREYRGQQVIELRLENGLIKSLPFCGYVQLHCCFALDRLGHEGEGPQDGKDTELLIQDP